MEHILVLIDYFRLQKIKIIVYNILIPALLASSTLFFIDKSWFSDTLIKIESNLIPLLGVLIGFSITVFTILTTSSNTNVEGIKSHKIGKKIDGQNDATLYDLLVVSIGYILINEVFLLIFNIAYPFIINDSPKSHSVFFIINIFWLLHILLTNIRLTLDFYFVILGKKTDK
ncbi:MAG: hypothetical protein HOO91_17245 [Bacteroidales bacterium]|nr:hypothetical protein [Bacteroidales bacterium]